MRSNVYPTTFAATEIQNSVTEKRAKRSARRSRVQNGRRSSVIASILADAGRGAPEYVERWVAGRGAE